MSTVSQLYPGSAASVAITCSVASLASDTNLLAGRGSALVDNMSNLFLDAIVSGRIRTGTSPTSGKIIQIYAYSFRKNISGTFTFPDAITGSDANISMTSANVVGSALKPLATIVVDATTGRDYDFNGLSIAAAFGGVLPPKWGLWIVHNTGAALDSSSGNFDTYFTPTQNTVA